MSDQLTQEAYELRRVYEADMQVNSCEVGRLIAEVERLTQCLAKANEQTEHFEREWYLREAEVERLTKRWHRAREIALDFVEVLCEYGCHPKPELLDWLEEKHE